jgi:HAD superfamily phosphoserine phosphatase-like hydrolase
MVTGELQQRKSFQVMNNGHLSTTLSAGAGKFIDSVLDLQPRIAVFDCDGTLWSGDAGERFFAWELEHRIVAGKIAERMKLRYADYKAGHVSEDDMCGEMVTMHAGLKESEMLSVARRFFDGSFAQNIFSEMRELVARLRERGSDVWAVSSTNQWVIEVAMKHFGIPANRILAASAEVEGGIITSRLLRIPSGHGKPKAIREVVKQEPDVAFGNSRWDAEMLKISRHAFAVNPNPDLEKMAEERSWPVYWPDRPSPDAGTS